MKCKSPPFKTLTENFVNAQKAKRCIGVIKVCIVLAFMTVIVGSYLFTITVIIIIKL